MLPNDAASKNWKRNPLVATVSQDAKGLLKLFNFIPGLQLNLAKSSC
jgi:hypothetical protein